MDKGEKIEQRDSLKVRSRGELIAAIRKKLGYSQEDLEWRSGVSKTQISRIERDLTNPSIETIRRLEKALDVPLMDLFLNPNGVDQERLLQVEQPGAVLSQFEKKLARKRLPTSELKVVLNKTLAEIEIKRALEKKRTREADDATAGTESDIQRDE